MLRSCFGMNRDPRATTRRVIRRTLHVRVAFALKEVTVVDDRDCFIVIDPSAPDSVWARTQAISCPKSRRRSTRMPSQRMRHRAQGMGQSEPTLPIIDGSSCSRGRFSAYRLGTGAQPPCTRRSWPPPATSFGGRDWAIFPYIFAEDRDKRAPGVYRGGLIYIASARFLLLAYMPRN